MPAWSEEPVDVQGLLDLMTEMNEEDMLMIQAGLPMSVMFDSPDDPKPDWKTDRAAYDRWYGRHKYQCDAIHREKVKKRAAARSLQRTANLRARKIANQLGLLLRDG